MWTRLEAARWEVTEVGGPRTVEGDRWKHADGRRALHTPAEDPPLLTLDADGIVIREYRPGRARPGIDLPAKDMQLSRIVAATAADDVRTPESDDEAWALLQGWV